MRDTWHARRQRADDLAATATSTASLLAFYAVVLGAQADLDERLRALSPERPTGDLARDLPAFRSQVPSLLRAVAQAAREPLRAQARAWLETPTALDDEIAAFWRSPSDRQFFPKAIAQPYAQWLASIGVTPGGRELPKAGNRCPFCGGVPQLSLFRGAGEAALEGAGRSLQCATCLTAWPFRRVLCPHCGEEDERKLGYFQTPEFDHVRVEACDSCRHYLKGIDLTRLGLAVPLVDEVASAMLDVWAADHGYRKIELNLVGL